MRLHNCTTLAAFRNETKVLCDSIGGRDSPLWRCCSCIFEFLQGRTSIEDGTTLCLLVTAVHVVGIAVDLVYVRGEGYSITFCQIAVSVLRI